MSKDVSVRLQQRLQELRLPAMRAELEALSHQASSEAWSHQEFLLELLEREVTHRCQRRIERLLKQSRLPLEKTWSSLDLKRLPGKAAQQLRSLESGEFLDRSVNVIVIGGPGSGKTHALCGLSQEWVRRGRRMLMTRCSLLVQELLAAKRDLTLPQLLRQMARYEGLLIDDLGYVQQSREEMEVLFTLLSERYERGSVLITTNLPFSKWEGIFKDALTTAAAVDRLVHHSVIVEMQVGSYRAEAARKRVKGE